MDSRYSQKKRMTGASLLHILRIALCCLATQTGYALDVSVRVQLEDFTPSRSSPDADVEIGFSTSSTTDPHTPLLPPEPVTRSDSGFVLEKSSSVLDTVTAIDIKVRPKGGWHPRDIRLLRAADDADRLQRQRVVYLIPENKVPNLATCTATAKDIYDPIWLDRAFAYFDFASSRIPEEPGTAADQQLRDNVAYNYAMSLVNACKEGYDTCGPAKIECSKLKERFQTLGQSLVTVADRQRIDPYNLDFCATIVAQVDTQRQWMDIRRIFYEAESSEQREPCAAEVGEGYRTAAQRAEEAMASFRRSKRAWIDNRISLYAIARDAGIAYLKLADFKSSCAKDDAASCALWRKARELLKQAKDEKDPSQSTRRNLDLLTQKLSSCAST